MSKIAPFPHRYTVHLSDAQLRAVSREPIAAGPPLQFGGEGTSWSPEDLLVGAALECLWTTFDAYARRDKLAARFSGTGTAVLERGTTEAPVPAFSSIVLHVELGVAAGEEERALRLLSTAKDRCIISHALRVPVTVEATTARSDLPAGDGHAPAATAAGAGTPG